MAHSRIRFILHGRRSPHHLPDRLLALFAGYAVDIHITTSADGAAGAARRALEAGCDYLVAVGGDGTVHEMVNGVMAAPPAQRQRLVLGVLPYGTGNDFARTLGIGASPSGLARLIAQQRVRSLDLGRVTCIGDDGREHVRYFANIASLGASAAVVERVARLPRWLPSSLAYGVGIVSALATWRGSAMTVRQDDGETVCQPLVNLCLANGRYFGGGIGIAPQAEPDDGRFDTVCIHRAGVGAFLRFLPALRQGRRIDDARIAYGHCRRLSVVTEPAGCPVEADGERIGRAPATFELLPGALDWLCGR